MKNKHVIPGEKVGVIEEFDGDGDAIINHGIIRATKVGKVIYDMRRRVAMVKGVELKSHVPRVGETIEGFVESVQSNMVTVRITFIEGKPVYNNFLGYLYLSQGHVKMRMPCKLGDVIRARVGNVNNGVIFLSINEPRLGVIRTLCALCGMEVVRIKPNFIKCTSCGHVDYRKLSIDFKGSTFKGKHLNKPR
jgi:exosome complex component CSL4